MTAWMSIGYDAGRLGTLSGTLTETGGGGATGSISMTGRYAHWVYSESGGDTGVVGVDPVLCDVDNGVQVDVGGYRSFQVELEDALNAIGNATYVVSFDPNNDQYTITASGGGVTAFSISSMNDSLRRMLGGNSTTIVSTALSWTTPTYDPVGRRIMHWLRAECGGWSEWEERDDDIDGDPLVGSDGSVRGLTALAPSKRADFVAPWEPREKIWEDGAPTINYAGTTWNAALARARCAEPVWISDPAGTDPYTDAYPPIVGFFRPDSCVMRPRKAAADYDAYQSIPLGIYVVGRGAWYNQV